jgi:hypothetical protein
MKDTGTENLKGQSHKNLIYVFWYHSKTWNFNTFVLCSFLKLLSISCRIFGYSAIRGEFLLSPSTVNVAGGGKSNMRKFGMKSKLV